MNSLNLVILLLAAYVTCFAESRFPQLRHLLGAQVDLLPPLMVYAGLTASLPTVTIVAVASGLWIDSLSANPFGVSVLPLALTGLTVHALRDVLVRNDASSQYVVGLTACALVPVMTLSLLILSGENPLYRGWFVWRWMAGAAISASFTPLAFALFGRIHRALHYQPEPSVSFRPDREIDRGRDPHAHH